MSGVDVVAVIRTAANRFQVEADRAGAHGSIYADSLYEARAAVAELIEAAKEKQRVTGGGAACTVAESNAVYRRMDAALARVTGAAA